MGGMFDFMYDIGNYDERAIARIEEDGMIIDTCRVSDGTKPIETGIKHPEYNRGKWVIVEAYDNEADALVGHARWVEIMKSPPPELVDCANAGIGQLMKSDWLKYPREVSK